MNLPCLRRWHCDTLFAGSLLLGALFVLCSPWLVLAADPTPAAGPPDALSPASDRSAVTSENTSEGCTIERFTVRSPAMGRSIRAAVVLPPGYHDHPEKRYPILHALHGRTAPYDAFSAMGPLRQALRDKPMIVACFDADNASLYLDSPYPQKTSRDRTDPAVAKSLFTTFFFDEFIPCLDRHYRADPARRMLTGFSMGGYGAFHYLLLHPDRFVSASSLSGAFTSWTTPRTEKWCLWTRSLLGPYDQHGDRYLAHDAAARVRTLAGAGGHLPPLLLCCGTEDRLLETNRAMRALLDEQSISCEYLESPGKHDWNYWKDTSPAIIDFHWRTLPKP